MKIKNLFFASLAALTFAACSNDDAPVPEGKVNFSLASVATMTKATSPSVGAEGTLSNVKIYVYNQAGTELVRTINDSFNDDEATLEAILPVGTYTVAAVANVNPVKISTLSDLKGNVIELSSTKKSFALFGEAATTLSVTENGGTCNIELKRLVAGIQMGDITFNLATSVESKYHWAVDNNKVKLVSLTLAKSFKEAFLGNSEHSGPDEVHTGELLSAEYGTNISNKTITAPGYTTDNRVYGYKGSALNIQLAVEYTFENGSSEVRYYNISSNTTLEANSLYTVVATITREGSSTTEEKDYSAIFNLTVAQWNTGENINGGEVGN